MSRHAEITRLIERAQSGDVQAFEMLIKEHLPSIRRYARAYASSQSEADDLAQEALIKVFTQLHAFKFQSSLNTWLFIVIKRACIDSLRRERRWWNIFRGSPEAHDHDGIDAQVDNAQHDHADVIQESRDKALLWRAINTLSEKLRGPLVLCDIEGLSYEEVAQIEKVPVGTVRSRLHRARAALREQLGAEQVGEHAQNAAPDAGMSAQNANTEIAQNDGGTFGHAPTSNSNEVVDTSRSDEAR